MGARTLLTAEQFDNYPFEEDKRYELDEGELIEMTRPAYEHNRILALLQGELYVYFRAHGTGEALISENLYALSPMTRRAPDLAIVLGERREGLRGAKVIGVIPDIVVEVLSPSERMGAVHRKLKQYFEAGVKEAWIVDPSSRTIEIWTGPALPERELAEGDSLSSPLLPGFSLGVAELFA